MIELSLDADGGRIAYVRGDGLIISTASGSTAHNLSAGGPILDPTAEAYVVTPDHRVLLAERRRGQPPVVELDGRFYKVLADFDRWFPDGVPSLAGCDSLKVTGPVRFIVAGIPLSRKETDKRVSFAVRLFLDGARPR